MPQIALIGAGIVGLTTALEIQAKGHSVTIYAESLPGDEKHARYTSPWAGAHHLMTAGDDPKKREYELETFKRLWAETETNSEESRYLMRTPLKEYFFTDRTGLTELDHMPDFRMLEATELVLGSKSGVGFMTITIDTAAYLPLLLARFLSRGGQIRRVQIQHIDQVLNGGWKTPIPDLLVVCAGIGARSLGGVEDKDVYPIRGQTVLVRAPWVKEIRGIHLKEDDLVTYIIPRSSGDVILGGTYTVNDWYPHPRIETGQAILARALALMPDLLPPDVRKKNDQNGKAATVADLEPLIIEHGCGFRPARKGGIRIERDTYTLSTGNKTVPIVHGGSGYQMSWGTASKAAELVEAGLN
ncbi:hypothetical protein Clacol_000685 [Clathrus columnatus]|uniref:FAD dependent oxidoreductase domain-containing protein n=1 Tax=Clathrus columnatus TaxID=1419009 RepID=A0AAV5A1I5_9AGAM|nr:hypothetical protein Clacol_000685 [Clathrus columnatus]